MSDKEYIDRGALLSRFNVDDMENINGCFPASIARQTIKDFPADDVVKVVRCKDCVNGKPTKNGLIDCLFSTAFRKPDFYCKRGRARATE